jgi:thiosulfate/3-mercaptopyruvate sulfurtransferase
MGTIRLLLFLAAGACGGHGDRGTMLVSTGWLAGHLHDTNLILLAVGTPEEYEKEHIPGSLPIRLADISTKQGQGLTLELPPMEELAATFEKLGVSDHSRVVVYPTKDMNTATARVFLTLDAMGMGAQTSILDFGLPAWESEHRAVTAEVPTPARGSLKPCPQADVITDLAYVKANLRHAGVDLVDARDPEFYSGAKVSQNHSGHIPGAVNIPYKTVIQEDGKLKSVAALQEMFRDAGVKPGDRVVTYCHIGQQASLLYFVARYLGYDTRLYDGSWQEWSQQGLPAEMSK